MTKTPQELKKEFREKFGQFYVSVDDKTNAIRIVDLEGGIAVNGEDGTKIRCVASGDIENYIDSLLHQHTKEIVSLLQKIQENKPNELTKGEKILSDEEFAEARGFNKGFNAGLTSAQEAIKEGI